MAYSVLQSEPVTHNTSIEKKLTKRRHCSQRHCHFLLKAVMLYSLTSSKRKKGTSLGMIINIFTVRSEDAVSILGGEITAGSQEE